MFCLSDGSLKLGAYKIFSWCFSANDFLLPSVLFHASCFNLSPNNIECQNHARQRALCIKASGTDHAKILWSAECLNVYCQKYICMFFFSGPRFPSGSVYVYESDIVGRPTRWSLFLASSDTLVFILVYYIPSSSGHFFIFFRFQIYKVRKI